MVSFNYNCLNKPEQLGSHPFSTRIFSAPGPDPLVFTGTNEHFPRTNLHSEAVNAQCTALILETFCLWPGAQSQHIRGRIVPCYDNTPGLTTPHAQGTAFAQHNRSRYMCCLGGRNILAGESCCAKTDRILELSWLSCLSSLSEKKRKGEVSWKFFFSPKKPGEVTYTETYIWSLVLSTTEQHDSRVWSDHPEVC